MRQGLKFGLVAAGAGVLLSLSAAQRPGFLARAGPGLWEIDMLGPGPTERQCIPDTSVFAQWEHRRATCTRVIIREQADAAEVHYTCVGGGFGRSTLSSLTPRSIRVETQGIAGGAPFHHIFQARRVGDCSSH